MKKWTNIGGILACVAMLLLGVIGTAGAAYPEKSIEFVPAGSPGGGLDTVARAATKVLKDTGLIDQAILIVNKGGGGGNIATNYMVQRDGSAYHVAFDTNRVFLNPILKTTNHTLKDRTPLARLITEYLVWVVKADSPYKSVHDVIEALKDDPKSVNFGVGTVPSDDQFNILLAVKSAGIRPADVDVVAFRSGGDLMTQLLGGHVDVISTGASEALAQYEAGLVRILAISAAERQPGLMKDMPTWKEQGFDFSLSHWRGAFGPPNMPQEAVDFWSETFDKMLKTPEWQEMLERYQWSNQYQPAYEFAQALQHDADETETLLREIGFIK